MFVRNSLFRPFYVGWVLLVRRPGIAPDRPRPDNYLAETGWLRSVAESRPVDAEGEPQIWVTYPCLDFLKPRVQPDWSVFEFGSGASTRWWAKRVKRVIACEHDQAWAEKIGRDAPDNVTVLHRTGDEYPVELLRQGEFDVIFIDGRQRVACAKLAPRALKTAGVIIWDNSDRPRYQEGYDFLISAGFRRLDFSGLGPVGFAGWTTSVFYRADNCLGL